MTERLSAPDPVRLVLKSTRRGFLRADFADLCGEACSIQESSLVGIDAVWLGINEPSPKQFLGDGTGWHDYQLPENVQCQTRMQLTREQVAVLIPLFRKFMKTGGLA